MGRGGGVGKVPPEDGGEKKNWRHENSENLKEKRIGGRLMKWCSQDCHRRPQWCGRRNCVSNADFAAQNKKRKEGRSNGEDTMNVTKDFKLALAALTTEEDYEALEKQFFEVKA